MLVYLATFMVSGILAALGSRFRRSGESNHLSYAFFALAVLLPSILAGCRDYSIGTDTNGYVRHLFATALNSRDIGQYITEQIDRYELGYLLLTFLSARITPDMHFLLFLAEAIILSVMIVSIVRTSLGNGVGTAFSTYLILHYNESFNLVRQSMAIAFIMLAVSYLLNKQYGKYVISILVATTFHSSGVIGLSFWVIEQLIGRDDECQTHQNLLNMKLSSILADAALIVAPIVFAIAFQQIMGFFIDCGLLSDKYEIYLSDRSTGIAPLLFGVYIASLLMLYLKRTEFKHGRFLTISYAYGVILFLLTGVSQHLWRLGTYFNTTISLSLALFRTRTREEAFRTWVAKITIIGLSLIMWYMQIVVWGNHDTFPYQPAILGI